MLLTQTSLDEQFAPGQLRVTPRYANHYIDLLDADRISSLPTIRQIQRAQNWGSNPYDKVPFWEGIPLFTTNTHTATVSQAIRDYGDAGVLDLSTGEANVISLRDGSLEQDPFGDQSHVIDFYKNFDSNIHNLARMHQGLRYERPRRQTTESLPHYNNLRIITQAEDAMPKIVHAYITGPEQFWYKSSHGFFYLFSRTDPLLFRPASPNEAQAINAAVEAYQIDQRIYSGHLASLIHGETVFVDASRREDRRSAEQHHDDVPVFRAETAGRQGLVEALQKVGYFDYFGKYGRGWEVKLTNSDAMPGTRVELRIETLARRIRL